MGNNNKNDFVGSGLQICEKCVNGVKQFIILLLLS